MDELAHVFIVGDDDCLHLLFSNLFCQCPDDVVSFIAGYVDQRNVECLAEPEDVRHLLREIVRHFEAVRLVIGEGLVSKRLLARFKNGGDVVGFLFTQQLDQHIGEDVNGLGYKPLRAEKAERSEKIIGAKTARKICDIEPIRNTRSVVGM